MITECHSTQGSTEYALHGNILTALWLLPIVYECMILSNWFFFPSWTIQKYWHYYYANGTIVLNHITAILYWKSSTKIFISLHILRSKLYFQIPTDLNSCSYICRTKSIGPLYLSRQNFGFRSILYHIAEFCETLWKKYMLCNIYEGGWFFLSAVLSTSCFFWIFPPGTVETGV